MIRVALLALLLFGAIGTRAAEPELRVIGVENLVYLPAYGVVDGAYGGIARELLDRFAAESGYRLEYRPLTVSQLYSAYLDRGTVALKFPDDPVWQSQRRLGRTIYYSNPVMPYTDGLWTRGGDAASGIRRIAIPVGFTPVAFLDALGRGEIELETVLTTDVALRLVQRGRVDGAYFSEAHGLWLQGRSTDLGPLRFAREHPHTGGWYRLSARDDPRIIEEFNVFLARNRATIDAASAAASLRPD